MSDSVNQKPFNEINLRLIHSIQLNFANQGGLLIDSVQRKCVGISLIRSIWISSKKFSGMQSVWFVWNNSTQPTGISWPIKLIVIVTTLNIIKSNEWMSNLVAADGVNFHIVATLGRIDWRRCKSSYKFNTNIVVVLLEIIREIDKIMKQNGAVSRHYTSHRLSLFGSLSQNASILTCIHVT